MKTYKTMPKYLEVLSYLLSLLICLNTSAIQAKPLSFSLEKQPLTSRQESQSALSLTTTQERQELRQSEKILVERSSLKELSEYIVRCGEYAATCAERLDMFEAYKKEADKQLVDQERIIVDQEAQLKKRNLWIPLTIFASGLATGMVILNRSNQ